LKSDRFSYNKIFSLVFYSNDFLDQEAKKKRMITIHVINKETHEKKSERFPFI